MATDLRWLASLLPLFLLLAIWEFAGKSGLVSPHLIAAPSDVVLRFWELMHADYGRHIIATMWRLVAGLALALVFGVTLGLLAVVSRWGSVIVLSNVRLLSPVPKIAIYPALMLTLGFGEPAREKRPERELGDAINRLVQSHIDVKMQVVDVIKAYGAGDLRKIQRLQSAAIEATLGFKSLDEAIHRDDLVVL